MFDAGGRRRLKMMRWGFPHQIRDVHLRGKGADIIGLVADLTNPMWEQTVVDPRCRCIIRSPTSTIPPAARAPRPGPATMFTVAA